MGRNIYSQYSTHLHNLMFKISYIGLYNMYSEIKNKYEEDRKNKVPYDELWYAKALKYAVETYHIDLLDICKFVFDNDDSHYKNFTVGVKTIQALYDFMQDNYGIFVSKYTAEELNKLLKQYIRESLRHDKYFNKTFHVSFDITLSVQAKDKDTAIKIIQEKLNREIEYFGIGDDKSNFDIKEIPDKE